MELKPGTRMGSVVCTTEVVIVRAPAEPVDLRCGGHEMVVLSSEVRGGGAVDVAHQAGTQLGKRYADAEVGIELLCTKAGEGSLSLGAEPLLARDAKPLPSSD